MHAGVNKLSSNAHRLGKNQFCLRRRAHTLECFTLGKPTKLRLCGRDCASADLWVFPSAHECRHCLMAMGWKRRACAQSNLRKEEEGGEERVEETGAEGGGLKWGRGNKQTQAGV